MKTFDEWCQDREIVLNELSPKFLAMAYKIWGEECFVEGQRYEAENAALRERLKKAVELPFYVFDKKTGKEADEYEIALNEDWAKHLMYCDMDGFAIEHDGTLMLIDECGQHAYCPSDRFEICNEARLKELQGGEE